MPVKNIEDLENKVLQKNKKKLISVVDPLQAGLDELHKSLQSIFSNGNGENKISLNLERFEKKWINNLKL